MGLFLGKNKQLIVAKNILPLNIKLKILIYQRYINFLLGFQVIDNQTMKHSLFPSLYFYFRNFLQCIDIFYHNIRALV